MAMAPSSSGASRVGEEDGRGAVGAADDAMEAAWLPVKPRSRRRCKPRTRPAGQPRPGAGSWGWRAGAEVRHGADAHEDQRRVHAGLDADVEDVQQAAVVHDGAESISPVRKRSHSSGV